MGGSARWHNLTLKKKLELKGVHPSLIAACSLPIVGEFFKNCVDLEEERDPVTTGDFGAMAMDCLNVSRSHHVTLHTLESDSFRHAPQTPAHVRINTFLEKEKQRGYYEAYYALKSIHLERVRDPMFVDELRNEIAIMRRLDHPHITRLIETYEDKKELFLVMELCSGGDLYSRDPYTEDQAARIIGSVLSAVDFMHMHGIVHRDLKYENILFANSSPTAEIK